MYILSVFLQETQDWQKRLVCKDASAAMRAQTVIRNEVEGAKVRVERMTIEQSK